MNRKTLFKLGISVLALSLITTPSISFAVSGSLYENINLVSETNDILLESKLNNSSRSLQSSDQNQISRNRMEAMISLAKKNPNAFLAKVISKDKKALLSKSVQANIESEVTVNGTFVVIAADNFKNRNETFRYQIRSSDRTYELYPAGNLKISSGDAVTVKGYALSNILVARANDVVVKKSPRLAGTTVPDSVGVQRTLVFMVKAKASDPTHASVDQVKKAIFDGQFNKYMTEVSSGKVSFVGDVYDWDLLSDPNYTVFNNSDDVCNIPIDTERLVVKNKINILNYDRVIYVVNNDSGYGCSELGKFPKTINGVVASFSESAIGVNAITNYTSVSDKNKLTEFDMLLAHELGHALGLHHANGLDCVGGVLSSDCENIEYGNTFDIMGGFGYYSFHYSAYYKYLLGWLTPDQVTEVNSSGQYEITPQENGSKTRLVKINIANKPQYFIEMRAPFGFDSNLAIDSLKSNQSGIFVNKILLGSGFVKSLLLDMSPGPAGQWYPNISKVTLNDPSLNTSLKQFNDPNSGITIGPITNVNINSSNSSLSSIKFNVSIDQVSCAGSVPDIKLNSYNSTLKFNAGAWYDGDVYITSNDSASCGVSDYTLRFIDLPDGWTTGNFSPAKLSLISGERDVSFFDLKVPNYAYTDDYTIKIEIKNTKTGITKIVESKIQVNGTPRPITAKDWIAPSQVKMGSAFTALLNFTGGPSTASQTVTLNFYDKDNILKFSENIVPNKLTTTWTGNTTIPAYIDIPGDVPPGIYKVSSGIYATAQAKRTLTGNPYEPVIGTIEIVDDSLKITEFKNSQIIVNNASVNSSSDIPSHVNVPNHSISILPWIGPTAVPADSSLNYIITFRGGPTQQNQRVFVHFVDQSGNIKFVSDIIPSTPTTQWKGVMRIPVSVSVPNNVTLGSYKVVAGLYSGNSSVPLVPENGVVVLGSNSNRYQVGTVSILRSASSPGLASTASVIDSVSTKKVESKSTVNSSATSVQITSTPTRGSSRSNYSSSPATPSPSSTPSPTASPTPSPSASPVSNPAPVVESRGSSPITTASPVTSVPSAPVAPAPAPAPVSEPAPAPAPVVSSPSPSSTPAPSPSSSPAASESI